MKQAKSIHNMGSIPEVSILMITFNQKAYVVQALDSALAQNTSFNYEIVIGEDCSTDGTRETVELYAKEHPGRICAFLRDKNLGMNRNFGATLEACRGKYVAILEGDDYWTSIDKLQKQVDFLNAHREYAICFHNVTLLYEDISEKSRKHRPESQKETTTFEDLLKGNYIPTCSVMFRRRLFEKLPEWFYTLKVGDWPLHLLNAKHGLIKYINEDMGIHRINTSGAWAPARKNRRLQLKALLDVYKCINVHFDYEYDGIIGPIMRRYYRELGDEPTESATAQAHKSSLVGNYENPIIESATVSNGHMERLE